MKSSEPSSPPTRLTLISHASTAALRSGSFPSDEELIQGEAERVAARRWSAPRTQSVWCGPEKRTRQTAEALGVEPLVTFDLMDMNYGQWKGKDLNEVQATDPDGLVAWLSDPDASPHQGEPIAQLVQRVDHWMKALIGRGHSLAITHPAVIRAAVLCALQSPVLSLWRVEISPLTITDLRYNGRHWIVRSLGCPLPLSQDVSDL